MMAHEELRVTATLLPEDQGVGWSVANGKGLGKRTRAAANN